MIDKEKALDILREINTIGAARVATVLSEMLGAKVDLSFPGAEFISYKKLVARLDLEETFFVIEAALEGDISGKLAFLLHPADARILGGNLLKRPAAEIDPADQLFQSSLQETFNIFAGSYTAVLSEMTRLSILYNVPVLNLGPVVCYLESIPRQFCSPEHMFFLNAKISIENIRFKGALLLLLDYNSVKKLFEALGEWELASWMEKVRMVPWSEHNTEEGGMFPDVEYLR
jgi:chemotaxis protein CheY-P-specific phosphatase CheC